MTRVRLFIDLPCRSECQIDTINFRANLETQIRECNDAQMRTHVIAILYEGGIECLYQAAESLSQGTPLLICKNSGGVADMFADVIHQYQFVEQFYYQRKCFVPEIKANRIQHTGLIKSANFSNPFIHVHTK
jgi:hypothetical protein